MVELISGKEAMIAWANKIPLEYTSDALGKWFDVNNSNTLGIFERSDFKFRLKPRTIMINDIEVPACGSNYQEGETIFVFDDCCDERGYIEYSASGYQYQNSIPKLWWRTEDEIKQVVAALRKVFKGE